MCKVDQCRAQYAPVWFPIVFVSTFRVTVLRFQSVVVIRRLGLHLTVRIQKHSHADTTVFRMHQTTAPAIKKVLG